VQPAHSLRTAAGKPSQLPRVYTHRYVCTVAPIKTLLAIPGGLGSLRGRTARRQRETRRVQHGQLVCEVLSPLSLSLSLSRFRRQVRRPYSVRFAVRKRREQAQALLNPEKAELIKEAKKSAGSGTIEQQMFKAYDVGKLLQVLRPTQPASHPGASERPECTRQRAY
jgi:hypothetical protein